MTLKAAGSVTVLALAMALATVPAHAQGLLAEPGAYQYSRLMGYRFSPAQGFELRMSGDRETSVGNGSSGFTTGFGKVAVDHRASTSQGYSLDHFRDPSAAPGAVANVIAFGGYASGVVGRSGSTSPDIQPEAMSAYHAKADFDFVKTVRYRITGTYGATTQSLTGDPDMEMTVFVHLGRFPLSASETVEFEVTDQQAGTFEVEGVFVKGHGVPSAEFELRIQTIARADQGNEYVSVRLDADARLELFAYCPADMDADGEPTGDDIEAFVAAFGVGLASADLNASGDVDQDDLDIFVESFLAGCD